MRDYFRLIIILAVISALAGGALALVNSFTEPKIKAYQAQAEANAYRQALPNAEEFSDLPDLLTKVKSNPETSNIEAIKVGLKNGSEVGWVCKVLASGFSSNIVMLVGISNSGELGETVIIDQKETPGLGTKITDPEFISQSAIKKAAPGEDLKVNKDNGKVQAVAGATISSRAVVRGINEVLRFYQNQTLENVQVDKDKNDKAITDVTNQ